jgi:hypothetical protein
VEQLTPKRISFLSPPGFSGRFTRSVSSGEFRNMSSRDSDASDSGLTRALAESEALTGSPPMAQSSGSSDSSADDIDCPEKEDVEEWAQNILEDSFVNVSMHISPPRRSNRSSSVGSDDGSSDSLSGSPQGILACSPRNSSGCAFGRRIVEPPHVSASNG